MDLKSPSYRKPVVVISMAALFLGSASCGGGSSPSDSQNRSVRYAKNATLSIGIVDDLGAFDPYGPSAFGESYLAYDPLVNLRPDGKFVSGLAEKWSVTEKSAAFTLRSGVTCSDGSPLTADQVAAAISYVGEPKNKSAQYGVYTPTTPMKVTSDDASRTVNVELKKPFGFLLNTVGQLPIVCAKGLKDRKLLASASYGTGPFVLTKVVPGQSFTFTVRRDYAWGPAGAKTTAPGTPAKVVMRVIPNETTRANLLMSGALNIAPVVGEDGARLEQQRLSHYNVPLAGNWLWFNQIGGRATADKRVRQALVHALDLNEVIKVNTGGTGKAATGLITVEPRPCPGDTIAGRLPRHDVALAERLLDQAGWTKGADGVRRSGAKRLSLDLHYVPIQSDYNKSTAELLAQRWRAIGVDVKLTSNTWITATKDVFQASNYDVYTTGFGFGLPSQMMPYLSGPVPPDGTNLAGIVNKEYDTLAAKAAGLMPPAACPYWNRAEQALYREVNPVPIANRPERWFLNRAMAQTAGFQIPVVPTSLRVLE
jgi:peptide/nickel transport system substrate-binding protein